ncbi:CaiB/BaiF CoA transferase family protein [Streptomyces muensis]|uniref:CoA transferase n=1 Tax=Streptomyces muensis TaxID=1077944 RepID=A0A9X1PSR3_STRM4|nr:CoA transferase [Streptomyces muensis]MCF1592321.1 CoA transferase [Streptomyces muensis]
MFEGVRVVELAQWLFVPAAGSLLADWGADVIHIENPKGGDPFRGLNERSQAKSDDGRNLAMELVNRGKRSAAIDVGSERGRELMYDLLREADVFLTNFRPGVLKRLGYDAETVHAINPRLVIGRGHGFGVRGPDADKAGYGNSAFWARGGFGHLLTPEGLEYPVMQNGAFGDRAAGLSLAFGVAGALYRRERTGEGSVVDASLLSAAMWLTASDLVLALQGEEPRKYQRANGWNPNPLVDCYRTKDGRHIQLAFLQPDRYLPDFCRLIGREDWLADERFKDMAARQENSAAFSATLEEEFDKRTYAEWCELLETIDVPWAPYQSMEEVIRDPQVVANEYIKPVDAMGGAEYSLPAVPVQIDGNGPSLRRGPEYSEHTERILLEINRSWEDIAELTDQGIIP